MTEPGRRCAVGSIGQEGSGEPERWYIGRCRTVCHTLSIVLEIGFAITVFRTGWTWALAVVNIALSLAFTGPVLWLVTTGQLMNPDALTAMRWQWGGSAPALYGLTVTLIVVASTWDMVDGFREAWRAQDVRRRQAGGGPGQA